MQVVLAKKTRLAEDGKQYWRIVAVHDSDLTKYDITGADVEGMADDAYIDAGSMILTPSHNYMVYSEAGHFEEDETGGGGGGGGTTNYNSLSNKPSIEGVTLQGNKTAENLGLETETLLRKPVLNDEPVTKEIQIQSTIRGERIIFDDMQYMLANNNIATLSKLKIEEGAPEFTEYNYYSVSDGTLILSIAERDNGYGEFEYRMYYKDGEWPLCKFYLNIPVSPRLQTWLDLSKYATLEGLESKVDKVSGKGLSTEDFTAELKTKLQGLVDIKRLGSGLEYDSTTGELSAASGVVQYGSDWGIAMAGVIVTDMEVEAGEVTFFPIDISSLGLTSINDYRVVAVPCAMDGEYAHIFFNYNGSTATTAEIGVYAMLMNINAGTRLQYFVFAKGYGASMKTVDTALSDSSTNPVENRVIREALLEKADMTVQESRNGVYFSQGEHHFSMENGSDGVDLQIARTGEYSSRATLQRALTAGDGIEIANDVISADGVPAVETSGYWTYRKYSDGTYEAWFRQDSQYLEITAASGNFYRSEAQTTAIPNVIGSNAVKWAKVEAFHTGYPVMTCLDSVDAAWVKWYAVSGGSRNRTGNYTIMLHVVGTYNIG